MKWREIKIITTNEAGDAVSEMLTALGAGGVSIEDPFDIRKEIEKADSPDYADDDFLAGLGDEVTVRAYFNEETNINELVAEIKKQLDEMKEFLPVGKGFAGLSEVDEEDWANAWKKYYKPHRISEHMVVKPSWEDYKADEGEIIIELDPGMAFGTGTHETTRMCADLLDRYVKQGDRVMDAGCGSGILAIMAAKLGARKVVAFDIDEVAVRVTRENIEQNNVSDRIRVFKGVLKDIEPEKFDIIAANIIANVIAALSGIIPEYLEDGGLFIASGIILERRHEVIEAYEKQDFVLVDEKNKGEWVALVFKKRRGN